MKIGLCSFDTNQIKDFLYDKNASIPDKLSVFFQRAKYFIPAGFTWINSDRVVTLLEANKLDRQIGQVFKNKEVSQSVLNRINNIATKLFRNDGNTLKEEIQQRNFAAIVAKFPNVKHPYFDIVRLASKNDLSEEDVRSLNSVNLDQLALFFADLKSFDEVLTLLENMGIEVDESVKMRYINDDSRERLKASNFRDQEILKAFGDFREVARYLDVLLSTPKESLTPEAWAFVQEGLHYKNLTDTSLIYLCLNYPYPGKLKNILATLKETVSPLISQDTNLDKEALDKVNFDRRIELIRALAQPASLYEQFRKYDHPTVNLILLAYKADLTPEEVDKLRLIQPQKLKNEIQDINRGISYLTKLSKLGLLLESDSEYFFKSTNSWISMKTRYGGRLLIFNQLLEDISYLSEKVKQQNWDLTTLTPDEKLLLKILPKGRSIRSDMVVEPVDEWIEGAKEPHRLKEIADGLKLKLERLTLTQS